MLVVCRSPSSFQPRARASLGWQHDFPRIARARLGVAGKGQKPSFLRKMKFQNGKSVRRCFREVNVPVLTACNRHSGISYYGSHYHRSPLSCFTEFRGSPGRRFFRSARIWGFRFFAFLVSCLSLLLLPPFPSPPLCPITYWLSLLLVFILAAAVNHRHSAYLLHEGCIIII